MELRVYDAALNFQGLTENQTSILWTRRYYEPGEFQIYVPLTDYNVSLFKLGNIVTFRAASEGGVIEDLILRQNNVEQVIVASGRFLSSYMDRRLIRPRVNYEGYVEVAMRDMFQFAQEKAPLPLVVLGHLNLFRDPVSFQATYKNLLEYETKLAKSAGYGFRFRPDFTAKKIYFEIYKGLDRSREQTDRAFVEFSDKFDNLNEIESRYNDQLLKNVAYVGGQGEGVARTFVTVGNDSLSGLSRREMFVDAKDISPDDLTEAQYLAALRERGNQKLAEQIKSESIECSTVPAGNYVYRKDYDLGDIVTVRKSDWGISTKMRITEITETYEHGAAIITPTLGDALPSKIDWKEDD